MTIENHGAMTTWRTARVVLAVWLGAITVGVLAGFAGGQGEPAPASAVGPVTRAVIVGDAAASGQTVAPLAGVASSGASDPDQAEPGADDLWSGFAVMPEHPAPDFALTDSTGAPWSLAEQRGLVTFLVFGYTRCPDVCPQTLAKLEKAFARMGEQSAGAQVALVTTDPGYDTPGVLAEYAAGFDLPLVGLTGSPGDVQAAGVLYAAQPPIAQVHSDDGHAAQAGLSHADHAPQAALSHADHSSRVWLIDASGQLRVTFMGPFTIDDVVHDAGLLLAERR